MNSEPRFTIRRMQRAEVNLAIEWAAAEGWNPGLQDAECFHAADPDGFLIGCLEDEPVGCISVVAYDDSFGFLGLYIVRPAFRGKGFGWKLWQAGIAYLGMRNIGLDGVVAQQDNYKKSGFHLAYCNIRYEGVGQAAQPTAAPGLVSLSTLPFEQICAYDNALFPAPRPRFLRAWLAQPQATGFAALHDGRLTGYGLLRPCRRGYKIGPLFADNAQLADALFQALTGCVPGAPVFLDVPEINPAAVMLAQQHRMHKVFETARMYTGQAPPLPLERTFGVTTFELG